MSSPVGGTPSSVATSPLNQPNPTETSPPPASKTRTLPKTVSNAASSLNKNWVSFKQSPAGQTIGKQLNNGWSLSVKVLSFVGKEFTGFISDVWEGEYMAGSDTTVFPTREEVVTGNTEDVTKLKNQLKKIGKTTFGKEQYPDLPVTRRFRTEETTREENLSFTDRIKLAKKSINEKFENKGTSEPQKQQIKNATSELINLKILKKNQAVVERSDVEYLKDELNENIRQLTTNLPEVFDFNIATNSNRKENDAFFEKNVGNDSLKKNIMQSRIDAIEAKGSQATPLEKAALPKYKEMMEPISENSPNEETAAIETAPPHPQILLSEEDKTTESKTNESATQILNGPPSEPVGESPPPSLKHRRGKIKLPSLKQIQGGFGAAFEKIGKLSNVFHRKPVDPIRKHLQLVEFLIKEINTGAKNEKDYPILNIDEVGVFREAGNNEKLNSFFQKMQKKNTNIEKNLIKGLFTKETASIIKRSTQEINQNPRVANKEFVNLYANLMLRVIENEPRNQMSALALGRMAPIPLFILSNLDKIEMGSLNEKQKKDLCELLKSGIVNIIILKSNNSLNTNTEELSKNIQDWLNQNKAENTDKTPFLQVVETLKQELQQIANWSLPPPPSTETTEAAATETPTQDEKTQQGVTQQEVTEQRLGESVPEELLNKGGRGRRKRIED